ncbi:recombinase family protein [Clostridiaceae bacterium OttesenSCG-928-D20]|nr:recombinase family protein [Clostridiaceae bacterium OttesenSCG-928-D20]
MARKSRKNIQEAPKIAAAIYIRSALYIRLSVEDNSNRGNSLETQRMILEQYLENKPDFQIVGTYIDNGVSGTTFEREGFQKMLHDIETGLIDCVLVKDLSRLGRSVIDTGFYIERYFPQHNVRFISVNDNYDTADKDSIHTGIMLPLKNMINEAYAKDISRKVRAQQQQLMQEGGFNGSRAPYGYRKHPDDCHKLIVDPEAAPVVEQIFRWAHEGDGLNTIVKKLNLQGISTPSHYAFEKGIVKNPKQKGNGQWQTFTVGKILSDEVYTGDMVQGKQKSIDHKQYPVPREEWIVVRGTHEPIVSREVFDAVQQRREQVAQTSIAQRKKAYSPNIWKGKVFCGHCGRPLHRQKSQYIHGHAYYLHCITQSRMGKGTCRIVSVPETELLEFATSYVCSQLSLIMDAAVSISMGNTFQREKKERISHEITVAKRENEKRLTFARSLYESLVTGTITKDEYFSMKTDYEEKSAAAKVRIQELESQLAEMSALQEQASSLVTDAKKLGRNPKLTAELVDRLIQRIDLYEGRQITITLRFSANMFLEVLAS